MRVDVWHWQWIEGCKMDTKMSFGCKANCAKKRKKKRKRKDLVSHLKLKKCYFFVGILNPVWQLCPWLITSKWLKPFAFLRLQHVPCQTCINRFSLPVASLWLSAAFGQASSCANLYKKSPLGADPLSPMPLPFRIATIGSQWCWLTSDPHPRGGNGERHGAFTAFFLKKQKKNNNLYVNSVCLDILFKNYLQDKFILYIFYRFSLT